MRRFAQTRFETRAKAPRASRKFAVRRSIPKTIRNLGMRGTRKCLSIRAYFVHGTNHRWIEVTVHARPQLVGLFQFRAHVRQRPRLEIFAVDALRVATMENRDDLGKKINKKWLASLKRAYGR